MRQNSEMARHKAQVPEWCPGIPVLVLWVAIAMLYTAAVGFAFGQNILV